MKVQHIRRLIYEGSNTCLLYFHTGWEKEAWCECLRGAAKLEYDVDDWYLKLKKEFEDYSVRVGSQQPSHREALASQRKVTGNEPESGSKKRRFFWRRLTRRSSKNSKELKAESQSVPVSGVRHAADGEGRTREKKTVDGPKKTVACERTVSLSNTKEESAGRDEIGKSASMPPLQGDTLEVVEAIVTRKNVEEGVLSEGRSSVDHGLLCWNMIISRMFFDIYHSVDVTGFVQQRIQASVPAICRPWPLVKRCRLYCFVCSTFFLSPGYSLTEGSRERV